MRKPKTKDLYYVIFGGIMDIDTTINSIRDSRDIDKATGITLDLIGGNVGQYRQGEDDDLYRLLIKTRIIANLSNGDIPTINNVLSAVLKEVFIGVQEAWHGDGYNEPASIKLKLSKDASQLPFELIDRVRAAGVKLYYEMMYATDYLNVSAREIGYKARYPMAGMTITESKKVDGNRNMLNISESYFKVKNNYLMAGQVSTAAVKNSIEREQIDIKLKAAEGGIKFQMAGMAIAGGAL